MRSREEQREDRREYWGDVLYDVWRAGRNSDLVDRERTDNYWYEGLSECAAANAEIKRQTAKPEASNEEQMDDCEEEE